MAPHAEHPPSPLRRWTVLGAAVAGVSTAAPLVRLSHAAPLAIATWRVGCALVVVAAGLLAGGAWRQWAALSRRDLWTAVGAGVLLALHFWAWNASLVYTTVAASVVLVNLQPVIVAGLSTLLLDERPTLLQWTGIGIAVVGGAVIASADMAMRSAAAGHGALFGDALALAAAAAVALYYVAGRRLREGLGLWAYVGLVYASCFVMLLLLDALTHTALAPQPPRELAIFAALAAGPMLLGHTGFNWALRYVPAYVVSVAILGEPVGATLLAAVIPGIAERPTALTLLGGGIAVSGILLNAVTPTTTAREGPGERS